MDPKDLPTCIGRHGSPTGSNGPCESCDFEDLCKQVIAKELLAAIYEEIKSRIENIEVALNE